MMAGFAASIDTDKLRKQLEENASVSLSTSGISSRLDYQTVPTDNRGPYLDKNSP